MAEHILSLSYGKDSIACLFAVEQLGWPLDRIVTADVWATDTIPADLPPMVAFKTYADAEIKRRWGIEVEHIYATDKWGGEKLTYLKYFYRERNNRNFGRKIYGFPCLRYPWCNSRLKVQVLDKIGKINQRENILLSNESEETVQYLGIAADETERIDRHKTKPGISLPLVEIGWDEAACRKICEENGLLSPIYTSATRGGCWFCHNQGVDQLRLLRKNYKDLWEMLLEWDIDSPVPFKPDGLTIRDFDRRFALEEQVLIPTDKTFRWSMVRKK